MDTFYDSSRVHDLSKVQYRFRLMRLTMWRWKIPPQQELDRVIPVLLIRAPTDDETGSVKMPQRYGVTVKRGGFALTFARELSDQSGIPTNRLHICDVYDHVIF